MVFPLLPLVPAGIAAFGAGARFLNTPTGQRIIRPGMNMLNRGITGLQNYLQPAGQMLTQGGIQRPITLGSSIPLAMNELATAGTNIINPNVAQAAEIDESMPPSNWMDELIEEEIEKEIKKKEQKKETKKEDKKEDKSEKIKTKDESKENFDFKKGGYVKKQRKRKHYKASGFVKMKKKKKGKYIKE